MATKEKLLKDMDKIKGLKKNCDHNFSQYVAHVVESAYVGYINGTINITDRSDMVIDIGNMTKWYNKNCRCEKK